MTMVRGGNSNHSNATNAGAVAATQACWRFRVVCEDGAFVRTGLELSSRHLYTIPFNSLLEVTERCINNQGLARLRTNDGWISEMLNPLSGQRGPIVEQAPLEQPLKYRVMYPGGALVRSGVELSSSVVGTITAGSTIIVTEKRFSNTPSYRCVPRLKLGDGCGWISMRINSPPPEDRQIVELIGIARPDEVGDYWIRDVSVLPAAMAPRPRLAADGAGAVVGEALNNNAGNMRTRVGDTGNNNFMCNGSNEMEKDFSALTDITLSSGMDVNATKGKDADHSCLVCFSATRTATFVHGETGHIACCLECARVLKGRGDPCPVCRLPVDAVIQHFWA